MESTQTSDNLKSVILSIRRSMKKLESDPAFLDLTDPNELCHRIVSGQADLDEICDGIIYCMAMYSTSLLQRIDVDELVELVFHGELPDTPRAVQYIVANDIRNQLLEKLTPIDRTESWAFFTPQRRLLAVLGIPFTIFAGLCQFCNPLEAFVLLWIATLYLQTKLRAMADGR